MRSLPLLADVLGAAAILAAGIACYLLFPNNLAFLTGLIAIAFLVIALDLVTGICGVATLGHAALFGAGAYAAGIASVNGLAEPFSLLLVGLVAGAGAGLLSGAVILRAHGLAQLVLSIAIVQLAHEGANKAAAWTGGSDGLYGITVAPLFGLFAFDLWGRTAYLLGLGLLVATVLILRAILRSPFGLLCRAIRQDPVRVEALGARTFPALLLMYVLSGAVAGLSGALMAISTQVVGLDALSFTRSAEALVMLVLGGTGSIFGALLGAFVFLWFEHIVAAANPFHWLAMVGVLLVAVVLFAPKGLYGTLASAVRGRRR